MTDCNVKFFDSTMSGAPSLSGTAGSLINVLDACLVNGFGSVTLTSLTVAGNIATGTVSGGHGFAMIVGVNNATPGVGPVITISGATPTALNGEWRLASVPNSTTFTFVTSGLADQVATGTISAKRAPANWIKRFGGTNKAAYAREAPATTMLLRIDDTPAVFPALTMYEAMADVDTGTGPAPISGSYYTAKSNAVGGIRAWRLFADNALLYFFCDANANGGYLSGFAFGDCISYRAVDGYACMLIAHESASTSFANQAQLNTSLGSLLARSHTQIGAAIPQYRYSHSVSGTGVGYAGNAYPALADNAFHGWPIEVWESPTVVRGLLPGLWNPLHRLPPAGIVINNIPQMPGRGLFMQPAIYGDRLCAMDISGPWR